MEVDKNDLKTSTVRKGTTSPQWWEFWKKKPQEENDFQATTHSLLSTSGPVRETEEKPILGNNNQAYTVSTEATPEASQPDCKWERFVEIPRRLALLDKLNSDSKTVGTKDRQNAFDRLVKEINGKDPSCRMVLMEELNTRLSHAKRSPSGLESNPQLPGPTESKSMKQSDQPTKGQTAQPIPTATPVPFHPPPSYHPPSYPPPPRRLPPRRRRRRGGGSYAWIIGVLVSILLFAAYYDTYGRHTESWTSLLLAFLVILLVSGGIAFLHHRAKVEEGRRRLGKMGNVQTQNHHPPYPMASPAPVSPVPVPGVRVPVAVPVVPAVPVSAKSGSSV